jgi:sulfur carrier protein ThiS
MRVTVNYDFTQQEMMGEKEVFELVEKTRLGELLQIIDARIVNEGNNKGIDTTYKTTLSDGRLNGCVVFINGSTPEKMLEQELHDGDNIEFVYGFCGG